MYCIVYMMYKLILKTMLAFKFGILSHTFFVVSMYYFKQTTQKLYEDDLSILDIATHIF